MRFTKFGKALSMGVLSAGVIFGVTSCVESYTVGFLYVTGNVTASSGNSGIISGYKIDHNTGKLNTIDGLPISTGGANPVRAVLTVGSRFLYVLNRGVNNAGNGDCYGTGSAECQNANITEFAVGGNGILTPQETFYTQGLNPFRLIVDSSGSYLMVLDHDAPDNASPSATDNCARALGTGITTCGDITVFQINSTTGRLSLVVNAQVTAANGSALTYFPVPANPVDLVLNGQYVLTLTGAPAPTSYPYTGGTAVWPYAYAASSGQLTLSQNSVQPLGIAQGNSIVNANSVIYVLDNEPITITSGTAFPLGLYPGGQILPLPPALAARCRPNRAAFSPSRLRWPIPSRFWSRATVSICTWLHWATTSPAITRKAALPGIRSSPRLPTSCNSFPNSHSAPVRVRSASLRTPRINSSTKPINMTPPSRDAPSIPIPAI